MTEFYLHFSVRYTYPSPAKEQRSGFSGVHCSTTRLIGNILTRFRAYDLGGWGTPFRPFTFLSKGDFSDFGYVQGSKHYRDAC